MAMLFWNAYLTDGEGIILTSLVYFNHFSKKKHHCPPNAVRETVREAEWGNGPFITQGGLYGNPTSNRVFCPRGGDYRYIPRLINPHFQKITALSSERWRFERERLTQTVNRFTDGKRLASVTHSCTQACLPTGRHSRTTIIEPSSLVYTLPNLFCVFAEWRFRIAIVFLHVVKNPNRGNSMS